MPNTYACNWCFQSKCSNISSEGLHFSAFHYHCYYNNSNNNNNVIVVVIEANIKKTLFFLLL